MACWLQGKFRPFEIQIFTDTLAVIYPLSSRRRQQLRWHFACHCRDQFDLCNPDFVLNWRLVYWLLRGKSERHPRRLNGEELCWIKILFGSDNFANDLVVKWSGHSYTTRRWKANQYSCRCGCCCCGFINLYAFMTIQLPPRWIT